MLWENNSTIVVMLTKLREMGRVSHSLGRAGGGVAVSHGPGWGGTVIHGPVGRGVSHGPGAVWGGEGWTGSGGG